MADLTTLLSTFLTDLYAGTLALTGNANTGAVVSKVVSFVENATNTVHTGTVTIPAGATLHDIKISNPAYWGAAAAVLKVGDTADDDGYFTGVNLKATDVVPGEVLSVAGSTGNWGGENGAYLVAATGRRGPASTNFGTQYLAASTITGIITVTTPAATTGRTTMTVTYSVGQVIAPVLT